MMLPPCAGDGAALLVLLLLMLLVGFADKNAKNSAREAIGASTDLRALLLRCCCRGRCWLRCDAGGAAGYAAGGGSCLRAAIGSGCVP